MMDLLNLNMAAYAAVGCVVLTAIANRIKRRNLPPGPLPLPVIGNALWVLGKPLHVAFKELQKKYGDIFCITIGSKDVIVINGFDNIHKALVSEGKFFNGRPEITWTSITQKLGIFSAEDDFYHKQKSVIRGILTEVGWDQSEKASERIARISQDLVNWLSHCAKKPFNPQIYIDTAVSNVNSLPLIGLEFQPGDDLMKALSKIALEIFLDAGPQNVNNYFTFLRNLPGDPTNFKVLVKNATTAMSVVQSVVDSHKEKLAENPEAAAEDFIDHYLRHVTKETSYCTEKQLVAVVTDLVAMGIQATATTIRWGLLILGQNQEIQNLLQQEIDEVIGTSVPTMDHKKEMDQMRAFITELQRYTNVVSINLPHAATADITFNGYNIPKGTIIIPNLASVHSDENVFSNPMKFDINRHLNKGAYQRPTQFMPYSAGTRTCLGMQLSKMEIFIFLSAILQKYSIQLSGEVGDDKYGLIRYPSDFNVIITPRSQINNN